MSPQLLWAVARGALIALATAGGACLAAYQVTGRWTPALVVGGSAFCSQVLAQLGVAGAITVVRSTQSGSSSSG